MQLKSDMATKINVVNADELAFEDTESCLVVPAYYKEFPLNSAVLAEEDELVLQALVDKGVITGKRSSYYYLPTPSRMYKGVLVLGLGARKYFDAEVLRRSTGAAVASFRRNRVRHLYLDVSHYPELPAEVFVEGINLGQYAFDTYKKPDKEASPTLVSEITMITDADRDAEALGMLCQEAALVSLAANGARHFANTAANDMTPTTLARAAQEIAAAQDSQCTCVIMEHEQMAELGMNALLGVARGGEEPPKLIFLEYRHPAAQRTVVLVGKGVTFDTGGISLKPSSKMHEMKYDMCGAAAVLCTLMAVSHLKPALNVVGVVPAVTNMPDGRAQTPGDIVRAYNGKTIEVQNTDAEGRLILADAMAYSIDAYKPDCMVDIATLTGAVVIALGDIAAAVLGNDDGLVNGLIGAGEKTGERVWRLPLWKDYEKLMEGKLADLVNIGPERQAGTITAAAFLKQFVGKTPWAHIDIAGVAYDVKNRSYLDSKYATGFGVRLFTRWLLEQAAATPGGGDADARA